PPTWSPCSCVTTIADSVAGSQPSARSRRSASRNPNPQSTSTRCSEAPSRVSTSSALPSLPLPRLAKRTAKLPGACPCPLPELFLQQREDLRRGIGVDPGRCIAFAIEHRNLRAGARAFGLEPELLRDFLLRLAAEDPTEETGLAVRPSRLRLGVDVAHEIQPLRTIAIVDGEAAAVEREADLAPRPVEVLVDLEHLR